VARPAVRDGLKQRNPELRHCKQIVFYKSGSERIARHADLPQHGDALGGRLSTKQQLSAARDFSGVHGSFPHAIEPNWGGRMFSQVLGFVSRDMAIDLGTANTLVYVPGRGIVLDEPSVVAVTQARDGERKVIAVGREAKTMLGRTPSKIETIQPLRDGVIADFAAAEEMIKHFIRRVQRRSLFSSPRIMICVPASATPVERRAVHEAGLSAGARRVYLIEEPVAAAIGAGLPITETRGSMIVDIGGGTTDIAVLSMGEVIYSHSIRTAGNAMDEAIVNYVRFKHHLLIGSATAEAVKKEQGSALAKANGERITIHMKGRDLQRGFPTEISLEPHDIAEALSLPIQQIVGGIRQALADVPPELVADLCDSGIYLTGGGALLERLDLRLAQETGVKFKIAEDPLRCVARGTGMVLEQLDSMAHLLIKP
jgi:rod shape-determining protein MreB